MSLVFKVKSIETHKYIVAKYGQLINQTLLMKGYGIGNSHYYIVVCML